MESKKKNSVLVVDDASASIVALTGILRSEYTIYAASNGPDAIQVAEKFIPDVILLDVLMPDMDGYAVIAALKSSEKTRDIPVIFITGLDNSDAEKKGLALGAVDYISKPFNQEIVRLRVQNQLTIVNRERALDERLRQQTLMMEISHDFLTDTCSNSLITNSLHKIGEFMDITQILLYKFDDDNHDSNVLVCQNEWIKPELGLHTRVGDRIELQEQTIPFIKGLTANRGANLCLHSNDPAIRDLMQPYRKHFHNYITTPIFIRGKMHGILDFSRKEDGQIWCESEINFAVLIASIFSGVFEREVMERQFSIVENSPNFVLYLTMDADVEYVSPAVVAVTGYTKYELRAKGISIIFSEKILNDIKETHIPNAMRGEPVRFEAEITRKDGEKRILMIFIVQTGKNNLGMITNDLTEIRELETDLVAAKELAEHSSRAKSEFLARMSHEMLTPMNAIIGLMHVVKIQRGVPNTMKEHLDEIDVSSHQLLHLIHDVLDISGMGYGVFKLSESAFDVNAIIQEALREANYTASAKRQSLSTQVDLAIPSSLTGDEKRLKQVITNLLANAIKYTPEQGEISFVARIRDETDGVLTLQFAVTDNGIGISKEQQEKLFNLFEQVDGGSTREYGGIGIGLALSERIIKMMGGEIWVDSELGRGSTFTFTCQLKKGVQKEECL